MHRYVYKVFYDGTKPFYGSQRQPSLRTVEGELFHALTSARQLPPDISAARFRFAGRTDRFVSALGNVFAVNLVSNTTPATINSKLKTDDIRVWASAQVQDSFNPRRALSRHYKYFSFIEEGTNLASLIETSRLFLGVHDFRHFAQRPSNEDSVRKISSLSVVRLQDNFLCLDIIGESFLRRMVRRIVGSLIYVARGLLEQAEIEKLFDPNGSIPRKGVPSASPEGLILWNVDYGFRFEEDEYAIRKLRETILKSMTNLMIKKAILNGFIESVNLRTPH